MLFPSPLDVHLNISVQGSMRIGIGRGGVGGGLGPRRLQPLPRQEGVAGGQQAQARVRRVAVHARAQRVPRGGHQAQLRRAAAPLARARARSAPRARPRAAPSAQRTVTVAVR